MKGQVIISILAATLLGCRAPVVRMAPPGEKPLRVNVWIHQPLPGREGAEARFSEALRDRLSDRARVVPPGGETLEGEAHLEVHVMEAKERGDLVKGNAKHAFVAPVKAMTSKEIETTSDLYGFVFFGALGVVAGTVAAPVAAVGTEARGLYHNARLGYKPRHLVCKVSYRPSGSQEATVLFSLGAWEVVKAMRPLQENEPKSLEAVRKEEAEALARVVVDRLALDLRWIRLSRSNRPTPLAQVDPLPVSTPY